MASQMMMMISVTNTNATLLPPLLSSVSSSSSCFDETKKVSQLSSGMRVKYMLALALSHDARLLILDEQTSGLDPVSRDELMELFRGVVQSGERSILFSTHITSDLEKCASHITMIKDGEILRSDTCAGFLAHYRAQLGDASLSLEDILVRVERRSYDGKDFL